jgi:hypothetical protein
MEYVYQHPAHPPDGYPAPLFREDEKDLTKTPFLPLVRGMKNTTLPILIEGNSKETPFVALIRGIREQIRPTLPLLKGGTKTGI